MLSQGLTDYLDMLSDELGFHIELADEVKRCVEARTFSGIIKIDVKDSDTVN